jgi:hypothetical protein
VALFLTCLTFLISLAFLTFLWADIPASVLALGHQVWQQQQDRPRDEGAAVCFVSIAPFLLAAAAIGLRSVRRRFS